MVKEEEKQPKGKPSLGAFIHNPKYRAERKRTLLMYLKKNTKGEDETEDVKKLVGLFSWKWGISTRRINEYVGELETIGAVVRRGNHIKYYPGIGDQLLSMEV